MLYISNRDEFIKEFNRLEKHLDHSFEKIRVEGFKQKIRESKNPAIKRYDIRELLFKAADLRNLIIHNNLEVALPTDEFLQKFKEAMNLVINPPKIEEVMVKRSNLIGYDISETIIKASQEMKNKNISNVLIFKENELVGIFNESTLFNHYVNENGSILIDDSMTFEDIAESIKIKNHSSIYFRFVKRTMDVYKARNIFANEQFKDEKRLELLLVTNNGVEHEQLLGIVSPYDLVSNPNLEGFLV